MPVSESGSRVASLVGSTAEAAFASDPRGRIVAWNGAAEHLFGIRADQAVGQPCHELLSGCDPFGNPYCREDCAPREMVCRGEPLRGFTLEIRKASGESIRVDVVILVVPEQEPTRFTLVHLVRPRPGSAESRRLLEQLLEQAELTREAPEPDDPSTRRLHDSHEGQQTLSQREVEILRMLSGGARPVQIADTLCISIHTVRTHIRNILHKLEVHGTTQAVLVALRRRLI